MTLSIVDAVATIKRSVAHCLSPRAIEQACRAERHTWRERELGPVKTIHAFLTQVLNGNTACSQTVRLARLACSTEAYCQARARLPLRVYERLLKETSQTARRSCEEVPRWHGHRTFLVDGSSFSMADTKELQKYFGQPGRQQEGCGFPAGHLLMLFDAASGLLVKQLAFPGSTHDLSQVSSLHPEIENGDVLVGDTAFASYAHLALLLQRNIHGVLRVHQRQLVSFRQDRKLVGTQPKGTVATHANSRLIRKLGKYDQVVEYRKPGTRPKWISKPDYDALPDTIVVRELRYFTRLKGGRTRVVTLVTTLLDPCDYPAVALSKLFWRRWGIETNLGHLKTTMKMDVLHCKTVDGVRKELAIYALVYNLTRLVMLKAADQQQARVDRVSFVDALRWLADACQDKRTPLRLIINPDRPNRHEPRVKKRRPKQYDLMMLPRHQLRKRLYTKQLAT